MRKRQLCGWANWQGENWVLKLSCMFSQWSYFSWLRFHYRLNWGFLFQRALSFGHFLFSKGRSFKMFKVIPENPTSISVRCWATFRIGFEIHRRCWLSADFLRLSKTKSGRYSVSLPDSPGFSKDFLGIVRELNFIASSRECNVCKFARVR